MLLLIVCVLSVRLLLLSVLLRVVVRLWRFVWWWSVMFG